MYDRILHNLRMKLYNGFNVATSSDWPNISKFRFLNFNYMSFHSEIPKKYNNKRNSNIASLP